MWEEVLNFSSMGNLKQLTEFCGTGDKPQWDGIALLLSLKGRLELMFIVYCYILMHPLGLNL